MKVALIWQGFDGRYGQWRDGLWAAMQLIEKEHEVGYFDFKNGRIERIIYTSNFTPKGVKSQLVQDINEYKPDVVLYWEAPVTNKGKDADNWFSVCALPYPKALLFAGGPLRAIDVKDFDLVFTESQINDEDCEREGIPHKRAFGVNTQIFKPLEVEKKYDAFLQATFAEWKRHTLFAEAIGSKGAVAGRLQEHDRNGYDACIKRKVTIFDELPAEEVNILINASYCVLNTSEYWGGGQRCTLEAMAAGIPVIVMADSPKNREYVEEGGGGLVVEPDANLIREAAEKIKTWDKGATEASQKYIQSKWTERHYADAILEGIKLIV